MTPLEQQVETLKSQYHNLTCTQLSNGSHLIIVPDVKLPQGEWNRDHTTVLFVAPPGFPTAQPDCFWVTPTGFRLINETTPQASNDSNPIPGDTEQRSTTWFSWHLQSWNPNNDTLVTYFKVILQRLNPAR